VPQNFIACDREQELLLPPSLREWLAEDHLAWFVLDAVEQIDLNAVYESYRADGSGRAAFDPPMMVALLLYAYAIGERSSRGIERRCREDVAFRVITANQVPDHATIARFRVRHEQALAQMFTQILVLCAKAGLVSVGLVALDGTRIAANAAQSANRTHEGLREEVERILAEAGAIDAAEDERFGRERGDELPGELADRRSRIERLRRCREELEAEHAKTQAAYEQNLRWRAQWETEHARKLPGRKPTPPDKDAPSGRKINTTDPDSRLLPRAGKAAVQGYNAQAVACPGQIVLAAEITQQTNDCGQLAPMLAASSQSLTDAGISEPLRLVLADAGYWSSPQIAALKENNIQAIVPTQAATRSKPRKAAPRQGPEAREIEELLATADGMALYRKRQQIIEPIFAHTKTLRRIDRFQRRGLRACQAEWRLITATHNLLKLWRATRPAIAA
jgi:transposase